MMERVERREEGSSDERISSGPRDIQYRACVVD